MTDCRVESYIIPSAHMGTNNPLPDIKTNRYLQASIDVIGQLPDETGIYVNKGMIKTILPYCEQDNFDRNLEDYAYQAVILENEHLKAVFLPELGGRLWSLFDKDAGRELLFRNPVVQPGNLALRNAWCSGGVEFNMSIKGHNPFTCDDVFARKITINGFPGIRIYEYERIRGCVYSIDAWLPDDSKFLYIRPRLENPNAQDTWQYWWSNIAVPVDDKTRVIVPADSAYEDYYSGDRYVLRYTDTPMVNGVDVSYPERVRDACDYFFYIRDEDPKWVTSVDAGGYGLVQCSTMEQKGRKLFLWGNRAGGDNWSSYLCHGRAGKYIEIQAGLARTQLEHIPMKAGAVWSWVEAYGAFSENPGKLHGDWQIAKQTVQTALDEAFHGSIQDALAPMKDYEVELGDIIHAGSGWGALENLRRKADGERLLSNEISFDEDTLTPQQTQWITLLKTGKLPERAPEETPDGYLVDAGWYRRLAESNPEDWYCKMHLGVMAYAADEIGTAKRYFEESIACKANCWSLRNLAMIYRNELDQTQKAADLMEEAVRRNPDNRSLWMDYFVTMLEAERYGQLIRVYRNLPERFRSEGRLQIYTVRALIELKQYQEAAKLLNYDVVMPDVKEGETSICDLWFRLYGAILFQETGETDPQRLHALVEEKYPLKHLDFRMF